MSGLYELEKALAKAVNEKDLLTALELARRLSDERYAAKWVERAVTYGLYLLSAAFLGALITLVIKTNV